MRIVSEVLLAACAAMLLSACTKESEKARPPSPAVSAASDRPAVLATIPEGAKAKVSAVPSALGLHPSTPAGGGNEFFFSARGGGVAFVAETGEGFRVIHNGRAGKVYSAVGAIALSPDGLRAAHGALASGEWRMVIDGTEGEPFSAVKSPVFSPDGRHVAYQAMAGELWHLVVDTTVGGGTRTRYLQHEFGADSERIAFIDAADGEESGRLVISDLAFKKQTVVDPSVTAVELFPGRTRAAAICARDGRQGVLTFDLDRPDGVRRGPMYDSVHGLTFGSDGTSLAYFAERSGGRTVVLNDREEPLPAGDVIVSAAVRPDGKGIGVLAASGGLVALRQFFFEGGRREAAYEEAEGLTYGADGRSHAYAARRGGAWFVVVDGREGPPFERVVSPAFSPDGRFLVYRARAAGKRFVVVANKSGGTVSVHPAYEQVFPVLFTADGKSVAYGVKDGRQLAWKVESL